MATKTTNAQETKGFYDYTDDEIAAAGTMPAERYYHLRVTEAIADEWPDTGDPRGVVKTEVVEGSFAGRFGPRITLSNQGTHGPKLIKNGPRAGQTFEIPDSEAEIKFIASVKSLNGGDLPKVSDPFSYDHAMMDECMEVLEGNEFVAWVTKRGQFNDIRSIFAMDNLPDDYMSEADAEGYDA